MLIEIIIGFVFFILGYTLGRTNFVYNSFLQDFDKTNIQKYKKLNKRKNIEIDESKFVTEIKTTSFSKNFGSLGEETISETDITDAVSKLKKLKQGK